MQTGFTIGIPAYERAAYTREAIDSCLAQDYENFEIIVNDDSRSGDIEQLVKSYASEKIRYYQNRPALGLCRNANSILIRSTNPWAVILANDDLLEPGYLKAVDEVIQNDPDAALIRTQYCMIDQDGTVSKIDKTNPYKMTPYEFWNLIFLPYGEVPWMSISAVAFPVGNLKKAGGFKDFHRGHHVDRVAWAELAAFGDCYFLQKPLAKIRAHREEISTTMDPYYEKAVAATLSMLEQMKKFFEEKLASVKAEKDRQLLKSAMLRLEAYSERQMHRCFDEGIMANIEQKCFRSIFDIHSIRKKMDSLRTTPFISFYFYAVLLALPEKIRFQIFPWFKEYKFRRWSS